MRFCGGVRSRGGCSFGGGDVSVHRRRGFDRRWEADAEGMRAALADTLLVLSDGLRTVMTYLRAHTY
jgi:hypothetical protein